MGLYIKEVLIYHIKNGIRCCSLQITINPGNLSIVECKFLLPLINEEFISKLW